MFRKLAISSILLLTACGGGGGSGHDSSGFAGTWDFRLQPSRNSCNQTGVDPFSGTVTVNQDGPNVVVDGASATYSGVADADGFVATSIEGDTCDGGTPASVNVSLEFSRPADSNFGEDEAAVFYRVESHCEGSLIFCNAEWSGSASRR